MFSKHHIQRTLPIGACAATILLCAAPAIAGKRAICTPALAAYKEAVEREKSGHLQEARELLQSCMQATVCGGLVPKCTAKYNALSSASSSPSPSSSSTATSSASRATVDSADLSSVVPVVTDDAGEPRVDVQVKVDGTPLCSKLDGKGLRVDPGVHEFSFSTDAGVFSTQKVMIVEGQRNRPISALLHSGGTRKMSAIASSSPSSQTGSDRPVSDKPSADKSAGDTPPPGETTHEESSPQEASSESAPKSGGRSLLLPFVLGGVGVAGLAAGGFLTYWGVKDNDALGQCKPSCPQSSLDHIRSLYIASDISAGVGVAALGVATWLYLRSPSGVEKPQPQPQTGYVFDVHPTPSGAFASVKGAF